MGDGGFSSPLAANHALVALGINFPSRYTLRIIFFSPSKAQSGLNPDGAGDRE